MDTLEFIAKYNARLCKFPVDRDNSAEMGEWLPIIQKIDPAEAERVFALVETSKARSNWTPRAGAFRIALEDVRGKSVYEVPPEEGECGICGNTGWLVFLCRCVPGDRRFRLDHLNAGPGELMRNTCPCTCARGRKAAFDNKYPPEQTRKVHDFMRAFNDEATANGRTAWAYMTDLIKANQPKIDAAPEPVRSEPAMVESLPADDDIPF